MNKKLKVLFVVMDFWQAGAQRFAYEVDSCLNKSFFEVHILSIRDLNDSDQFDDFYYDKHLKLGSEVHFLNKITNNTIKANRISNTVYSLKNKLFSNIHEEIRRKKIRDFLSSFEAIGWMGEYTITHFAHYLTHDIYNKSVIHLMNARFQNAPIFYRYPKDRHYIFTAGFDDIDQVKFELSEFTSYSYFLFSLYLKVRHEKNNWNYRYISNKKIGIFTRLDFMKPLDPFLYAFHLLLDTFPELELHIYGSGDPEKSGTKRYTRTLGIENSVFFRGHQEDIVETAKHDELDLVWFQGYKNRPAGYAGFDICTSGVPQLFWEFTYSEKDLIYTDTYPIYKNLNLLVKKSTEILSDQQAAMSLSNSQFNDVIENRNMEKKIGILEEIYLRIIDKTLIKNESKQKIEIVLDTCTFAF